MDTWQGNSSTEHLAAGADKLTGEQSTMARQPHGLSQELGGQLVQESISSWDNLTPSDSYTVLLSLTKPICECPGLTVGLFPCQPDPLE